MTIFGYDILNVMNQTHAKWDWVHTGQKSDHNIVHKKQGLELPPGGVDSVYIENVYSQSRLK